MQSPRTATPPPNTAPAPPADCSCPKPWPSYDERTIHPMHDPECKRPIRHPLPPPLRAIDAAGHSVRIRLANPKRTRRIPHQLQYPRVLQQLDADRGTALRGVQRGPGAGAEPDVRRWVQTVDQSRASRDEGPARVRHPRPRHGTVRLIDPGQSGVMASPGAIRATTSGRDRAIEDGRAQAHARVGRLADRWRPGT